LPDSFPKLIGLACHDLRTPLATVRGFMRTLAAHGDFDEASREWLNLVDEASAELAGLIDQLSLAARIEAGEYDPARQPVASDVLAQRAAAALEGRIDVAGEGAPVLVEEKAAERALTGLGRCQLRHGELERAQLELRGPAIAFAPVDARTAAVMLGDDLRDLQAAVAVRVVRALGGEVAHSDGELLVSFPAA
jgi:signal transduction histidine kinase